MIRSQCSSYILYTPFLAQSSPIHIERSYRCNRQNEVFVARPGVGGDGAAELSLAEFVAGEVSQTIVRGVFIHFRKRRIVEYEVDEEVESSSRLEDHHSQMNELGGIFADDVDAEQLAIAAPEQQLHQAGGVARDQAASVVLVVGTPDDVVNFLFLAAFLRFTDGRNFRNRIYAHGKHRGQALFVVKLESMADGYAPLFHRG